MAKFLGIDTGGTFTDFMLFDDHTKSLRLHKVLSTPKSPEKAILQGLQYLNIKTNNLILVHGSTVATNAILEGKGVRTAYIANQGLADVLSIGRQAREQLYNLTPGKKPPLIPAELCLQVNSRLSAQGEHLQKPGEQDLPALIKQLQTLKPKAVAINLLYAFFNDSEERKIEQMIIDHFGTDAVFISRSSDVLPEYKEYERGMATVLNAMVGPLMQGYLKRLEQKLNNKFTTCTLSVMQSSGGTINAKQAGCYPVKLLLSGPAGGLKGAQSVAAASGFKQLLSFDMGGTSTDVSIIDKQIGFTVEGKIGGYPVAVPMVDMHTIGAGGGSIAQLDAGGLLLVGPESAGADPGPACYGKGGKRPTVTDANVVLARLLPQSFLGGNMQLDKDAAIKSVNTLAQALSSEECFVSVEQAAQGIIDVVNDHMVRALRVMSVERGEDPKDFVLVSFGGAGGLHACALAEELEMKKALIPINAGVLSALGMLAANASRERSRTLNKRLSDCVAENIEQIFAELVSHAKSELVSNSNHLEAQRLQTSKTVDVRYQGQSHTLSLPWHGIENIEQCFHQKHGDSYGHHLDIDIELVNLRVQVVEQRQPFLLPEWQATEAVSKHVIAMPGIDEPVVVINRASLNVAQKINGPALITETSSTSWLAPGWSAEVDASGNLLLKFVQKKPQPELGFGSLLGVEPRA